MSDRAPRPTQAHLLQPDAEPAIDGAVGFDMTTRHPLSHANLGASRVRLHDSDSPIAASVQGLTFDPQGITLDWSSTVNRQRGQGEPIRLRETRGPCTRMLSFESGVEPMGRYSSISNLAGPFNTLFGLSEAWLYNQLANASTPVSSRGPRILDLYNAVREASMKPTWKGRSRPNYREPRPLHRARSAPAHSDLKNAGKLPSSRTRVAVHV